MKINNLPNKLSKYVVARNVDGEYWFWGTWQDEATAYRVAEEEDGQVFLSDANVEKGE